MADVNTLDIVFSGRANAIDRFYLWGWQLKLQTKAENFSVMRELSPYEKIAAHKLLK